MDLAEMRRVFNATFSDPKRPQLKPRFFVYSAAAYLIPVVIQVAFPEDPTLSDELVWLVTLVPAFLLSLHYGILGAVVALVCGTALLVSVQIVLVVYYTPDDWRVTVPTYIAYGVLAVSVGWLSDQLHAHYSKTVDQARGAAIGELAVTVRHELSNSVTALLAETAVLSYLTRDLDEEQKQLVERVENTAQTIADDLSKFERNALDARTKEFGGVDILSFSGTFPTPKKPEDK